MDIQTAVGSVAIPPDHFCKRILREYGDRYTALVREFLQNSVDAGACRIEFITSETGLVVRDDGRGIKPERMVEALLTMGGSVKDDDEAVGGFGLAKEILLFCHDSYRISSLGVEVIGKVLQYRMGPAPEVVRGAEFAIEFSKLFDYDRAKLLERARTYLASCHVEAEVWLDGERVLTDRRGRKIGLEFEHGRVLCRRLPGGETTTEMLVRVRGMTMFEHPVPEMPKQVIVELEGDFRGMLTSNREGLRHPYCRGLSDVVRALTVDRKSFDRKEADRRVFPGLTATCYTAAVARLQTLAAQVLGEPEVAETAERLRVAALQRRPVDGILSELRQRLTARVGVVAPAVEAAIRQVEAGFTTDFVVSLEGTDYRKPPACMRPGTMTRPYRQLAQRWKYVIDRALALAEMSLNYRVGFVLDPDKLAYFARQPDGSVDLLINPKSHLAIANRREAHYTLLATVAHELAHAQHVYHDEYFVRRAETILCRLLVSLPAQSVVEREARSVQL